jgi:hypothetical protein
MEEKIKVGTFVSHISDVFEIVLVENERILRIISYVRTRHCTRSDSKHRFKLYCQFFMDLNRKNYDQNVYFYVASLVFAFYNHIMLR